MVVTHMIIFWMHKCKERRHEEHGVLTAIKKEHSIYNFRMNAQGIKSRTYYQPVVCAIYLVLLANSSNRLALSNLLIFKLLSLLKF
jgi:hypothetical protein